VTKEAIEQLICLVESDAGWRSEMTCSDFWDRLGVLMIVVLSLARLGVWESGDERVS